MKSEIQLAMERDNKRARDEASIKAARLQAGLGNEQLLEAWAKKLLGVNPTERDLNAFALGAEVGYAARTQTRAAVDVLDERQRQIEAEGWTPEHDDAHAPPPHIPGRIGELALAASSYLHAKTDRCLMPIQWPWGCDAWKPKDYRRNLVRAAALVLAEIERLDRAGKADHG